MTMSTALSSPNKPRLRAAPAAAWIACFLATLQCTESHDDSADAQISWLTPNSYDRFVARRGCLGVVGVWFSGSAMASSEREAILSELNSAATSLGSLACLGAVSCLDYPLHCRQLNIKYASSMLLYPPGTRTARYLRSNLRADQVVNAVTRMIASESQVITLSSAAEARVEGFLADEFRPVKVILFSSRTSVPPALQLLSFDPEIWPHINVGYVTTTGATDYLSKLFSVTNYPSLLLQPGKDPSSALLYKGEDMTVPAIRQWILEQLRNVSLDVHPSDVISEVEPAREVFAPRVPVPEDGASQSWVYEKLYNGAPGCPPGQELQSVGECDFALRSLGIDPTPTWVSNYPGLPSKCSVRMEPTAQTPERMHYNSAVVGSGRQDLAPICRRPAASSMPSQASSSVKPSMTSSQTHTGIPAAVAAVAAAKAAASQPDGDKIASSQRPGARAGVHSGPEGESLYQRLAPGARGCPLELAITSPQECRAAIESLGILAVPMWVAAYDEVPSGCSVRENISPGTLERMHFNSALHGSGRKDLAPVCRRVILNPNAVGSADLTKVTFLPELSETTHRDLFSSGFCLIYIKEGHMTLEEHKMLTELEERFKPRLRDQGTQLVWTWMDARIERSLNAVFDPLVLPSAVLLKPQGARPRFAMAIHREIDDEPQPVAVADVAQLIETVLEGNAHFTQLAAKKLTVWAHRR